LLSASYQICSEVAEHEAYDTLLQIEDVVCCFVKTGLVTISGPASASQSAVRSVAFSEDTCLVAINPLVLNDPELRSLLFSEESVLRIVVILPVYVKESLLTSGSGCDHERTA
jgi:hypothetical protein